MQVFRLSQLLQQSWLFVVEAINAAVLALFFFPPPFGFLRCLSSFMCLLPPDYLIKLHPFFV